MELTDAKRVVLFMRGQMFPGVSSKMLMLPETSMAIPAYRVKGINPVTRADKININVF